MSKKHFEAIAKIISHMPASPDKAFMVTALSEYFTTQNRFFNQQLFEKACATPSPLR